MTSTSVLGRESKIARSNEENWSKGCSWMMYFHLLVKMRNPHCGCILILLSFIANKSRFHPDICSSFEWCLWCSEKLFTQPCFWDNRQWTVVLILSLNNWVSFYKGYIQSRPTIVLDLNVFYLFQCCSTVIWLSLLYEVSDWFDFGKYEKEDITIQNESGKVFQKRLTLETCSIKVSTN